MPLPIAAQQASAELFEELREAEPEQAPRIVRRIEDAWSDSGSAAMDLLLKRGRDALEVNRPDAALGHFTALTDHAPDFAEGWHGMALSYYRLELFGPAMEALERTLTLNPQHFGALAGVGAVLEQTNRPELAYRAFQEVLRLNPHDEDVQTAIERLEPRVGGQTL